MIIIILMTKVSNTVLKQTLCVIKGKTNQRGPTNYQYTTLLVTKMMISNYQKYRSSSIVLSSHCIIPFLQVVVLLLVHAPTFCVAFSKKLIHHHHHHHHLCSSTTSSNGFTSIQSFIQNHERSFCNLNHGHLSIIPSIQRRTISYPSSSTTTLYNHIDDHDDTAYPSRRSFLHKSSSSILLLVKGITTTSVLTVLQRPQSSQASGLIQFPCRNGLVNKYIFVRVGETLLEEENIWSTNPLFLTNREAKLSLTGISQIQSACTYLQQQNIQPTIVRYSLAASSIESADIIGKQLRIGRDRLVPEFTYMDPRAVGKWDYSPYNTTQEAVWAMDVDESGPNGENGRPPPNEDGTPNETLKDQVSRLTQLLSVLETQYSGDTVMIVFPDGTGPALLSCLIAGIPLNRVHELEYASGEMRIDIRYDTVLADLERGPLVKDYAAKIERGREYLNTLRENPDVVYNVQDLKYEEELRAEEERKQKELLEKKRIEKLEAERKRKQRALEMEAKTNGSLDSSSGPNIPFLIAGITAVGSLVVSNLFKGNSDDDDVIPNSLNDDTLEEKVEKNSKDSVQAPDGTSNNTDLAQEGNVIRNNNSNSDSDSEMRSLDDDETFESSTGPTMMWNPDEDDGGEAWLGMLSDIITEDDEFDLDDEYE